MSNEDRSVDRLGLELEALKNRERLDRAWREVPALVPGNRKQREVKRLATSLLGILETWCRPGRGFEFETAWKSLELFRWLFTLHGSEPDATA